MSAIIPSRIIQIAIPVKDIKRAVNFYREMLQLRFLFEAPPQLAFFDCGGVRLMLSVPESKELERMSSVVYFGVSDIHTAHRALVEKGVAFEGEPHMIAKMTDHDLWLAAFRDSEGNMMALMSEVRVAAA